MARTWVSVNQDKAFGHEFNGKFHEVGVVKAGSVGFIADETADDTAPEGKVYVRFPECFWLFDKDELVEVSPYDLETSIGIIDEFEGHHTGGSYYRGGGQFQFNIKFYHWETSPLAEKYLDDEEIGNARWDILENELRKSFDQSWCDGNFAEDLGWVKSFHTAGRMGGWLVLTHDCGYSKEYFEERLEELKYELDEAREALAQADEDDKVEYEQVIEDVEEELAELQLEANDLARDLELTKYYIAERQDRLKEYMKTEECWEPYYEDHVEAEREAEKDRERRSEFTKGWQMLIGVSNRLDDEAPELAETLNEAISYMHSYVSNRKLDYGVK